MTDAHSKFAVCSRGWHKKTIVLTLSWQLICSLAVWEPFARALGIESIVSYPPVESSLFWGVTEEGGECNFWNYLDLVWKGGWEKWTLVKLREMNMEAYMNVKYKNIEDPVLFSDSFTEVLVTYYTIPPLTAHNSGVAIIFAELCNHCPSLF